MDIEVIEHHRNKAENVIRRTLYANGVRPTESLIEDFLSFYDYNGLNETLDNMYRYANKVTNRLEDQLYLRFHTVFY